MWVKVLRVNSHHGWSCWVGDIIGAWFVFFIGWKIAGSSVYAHFVAEYSFALALGVLVSWYTRYKLMGMSAGQALLTAVPSEFLGITAMLGTFFAWMPFIQPRVYEPALATATAAFWGINMIPGMIFGFIVAYPVSWWLFKKGWKHSM